MKGRCSSFGWPVVLVVIVLLKVAAAPGGLASEAIACRATGPRLEGPVG